MDTMKRMNKVFSTMRRRPTSVTPDNDVSDPSDDSPEATASRCVRQFCESSGPNNSGDEVTLLPPIVDAAESSPAAAAECARLAKKYMHRDYWSKPSYQYNAIMLLRILADNPGPTFTRNFDKKFVDVVKELLRGGRDNSVRSLLMETLDSFENLKAYDENLALVIEMWKKEKDKANRVYGNRPQQAQPRSLNAPPFQDAYSQNYFARAHSNNKVPDAVELTNRLEEARTSAKLLEEVVAITPPADVLSNELIKEFADRCLSASRSIQGYMAANDPAPDNDTMEGLIDTNEQLQQALNHHQRAVLNARKILGLNERSSGASSPSLPPPINEQTRPNGSGASAANSVPRLNAPPLPQRKSIGNGKGKAADVWKTPALASGSGSGSGLGSGFGSGSAGPLQPTSGTSSRREDEESGQDPFRDASEHGVDSNDGSRLAYEHFHPGGFNGNTSTWASGATSSGKAQVAAEPVTPVSDDEDLYHATPQRTGGADSGGKGTSSRY